MNNKIKFALIAFVPSLSILLVLITLMFLNLLDIINFLLYTVIAFPYCIALYIEYSKKRDPKIENLSDYELNLIQEKDNIIKSLEIIIISFSLLFGLFTAIEFDFQLAGDPSSIFIRLIAAPFGVDFFMATFVYIQAQVFGKDAYLKNTEIEELAINSKKSEKIKNMLIKIRLANFTRKGCYYSLLIQISMIYPIVITMVSI